MALELEHLTVGGLVDAERAPTAVPADAPARPLARPALCLDRATPVYEALATAREHSEQLMVVTDGPEFVGVLTVADILRRILPEPRDTPAPTG